MEKILIEKSARRLTLILDDAPAFSCALALGFSPSGHKLLSGDGKTPEGAYYVCVKRAEGKFGCALGLSYPSVLDARAAVSDGRLSPSLVPLFEQAQASGARPPWGTPLGGEIYIHGGGTQTDWTAGCIALSDSDMAVLFKAADLGMPVVILP